MLRPLGYGDGCSLAPDYVVTRQGVVWLGEACEAHDRAYAEGGPAGQRKAADLALYRALQGIAGTGYALLYWTAVRLAGGARWQK